MDIGCVDIAQRGLRRNGHLQATASVPGLRDRAGRTGQPARSVAADAEQRNRWYQIETGFIADLGANWREIRQRREALITEIFSSQPERSKIDVEQARIAALQDAQQRGVIKQLLAERELLDQRQRAALMALLLKRYANEVTEEELLHREH